MASDDHDVPGKIDKLVLDRRLIGGDPLACAEELDGCEEVVASFVVSGGQASGILKLSEEALDEVAIDAITLFGDSNTKNVVLEKSYREYMEGFADSGIGAACQGFVTILDELKERFPEPT